MDTNLKLILKKILFVFGIIGVSITILIGFYLYGITYMPEKIQAAYQQKDCDSVLNTHRVWSWLYPIRSLQGNLPDLALECALYTNAEKLQEAHSWMDAHKTYKACAEKYPNGILALDANQKAAFSLISLAREQSEKKSYSESINTLQMVMGAYPDVLEAQDLYANVLVNWSKEYQAQEKFLSAEDVLLTLENWAHDGAYEEYIALSQAELSNLYLGWGENYQKSGESSLALSKYWQAIQLAPDSDAASRAGDKRIEIFLEQGEKQVSSGDFQAALQIYQGALEEADVDGKNNLNLSMVKAYIAWAQRNVKDEDYYQALEKIRVAAELPLGSSVNQDFESIRQEIYAAFSDSTGSQAQQLIKDAAKAFCTQDKKAFPPVLGSDVNSKLAILYGIDDQSLPVEWIAETPGQFHYLICIETEERILEDRTVRIVPEYFYHDPPYNRRFTRTQFFWKVRVIDVISGEIIANTIINGSDPPPLDPATQNSSIPSIRPGTILVRTGPNLWQSFPIPPSTRGEQPDINELIRWLEETVMKE